jgi:hypothetical protein
VTTVAFDAAVDAGGFASSSSRSWSHTIGSGTNRVVYAWASFWNSGGSVSSATCGGTSMTRVLQTALSGSQDRVECWRLLNPASGAQTIVVNFSASSDGETWSISWDTVNQTTPERNTGSSTASGATHSISATGALTGDAIMDGLAWSDRNVNAAMGTQTNRTQRAHTTVTGGEGGAGSTVLTAPNPQTLDWSSLGTTDHALGYVVIANDGGGAAATSLVMPHNPLAAMIGR